MPEFEQHPKWRTPILLGMIAALLAGRAGAQVPPASRTFTPESSYAAVTQLRRAAEQVKQGQWPEAIDLYQKIAAQYGDSMTEIPKGDAIADPRGESRLFVDARSYAQAQLAALPPEALAVYRSRVDAQAERLYRQGKDRHDRAAARRVIDQFFCSSWGDEALDLLGDLSFQDGQFSEALGYYRRLVPDDPNGASGLTYRDPQVDLAKVSAKKLLCREALGLNPPTAVDLRAFAAAYPEAKGNIAGRNGLFLKSLEDAIAGDHLQVARQGENRWPTFAGAASRSKVMPRPVDVGQIQWRAPLDPPQISRTVMGRNQFGFTNTTTAVNSETQLAYHPIVVGDQVVVCNEGKLTSYYLNGRGDRPEAGDSGPETAWTQPPVSSNSTPPPRSGGSAPRFTLTASGDRVFARQGPLGRSSAGTSSILAVRNNRDIEGKLLWRKSSNDVPLPKIRPDAPARYGVFEGSPVADARNVYVGLTESATETSCYVAALDAETGAVAWVKFLGTAPASENAMMGFNGMGGGGIMTAEIGNRLLSLDGQTLYYQTNLGAVAALDAETGSIRWLTTYPTRDRQAYNARKESNPAVVHDGMVFVAPDDALPIFAFDAATGRMLWKTGPMEKVTHLLGVARGRLVATGDRVYLLDAKDGKLAATPWPDGPTPPEGYGRGLLAGDSIYWPTKTEIWVLDQATGAPGDRERIRLKEHYDTGGGNLAVGDGYLVIAQNNQLVVFCQNSRLIERLRQEIAKAPDRADLYYQLAGLAESTGDDDLALANLEEAVRRVKASDLIDGQPLADEAAARLYRLLMRLAAKAAQGKDWATAARRFEAASRASRGDRERLSARLRLASAQVEADRPGDAVATLQEILQDPKLRSATVQYDDRWTVRADLLIAEQLEVILKARGRSLYDDYDRKARAILEAGKAAKDPRQLEELGKAYPCSRVVPEALLALGSQEEAARNFAEAARAYRHLLAVAGDDGMLARGWLGLGRSYLAAGLRMPAREAFDRAHAQFAAVRLPELGPEETAATAAAAGLKELGPALGDAGRTVLPIPLGRVWERRLKATAQPLEAAGIAPSAASGRVFLAEKGELRPVDPASGESAWVRDLGAPPIWVGYLADRVIAATSSRVVALDVAGGTIRWSYPDGPARPSRHPAAPFAKPAAPPADEAKPEPTAGPLHDFRVVGGRVFCLRGDRELVALDGESGEVEWSFAPVHGGINPFVSIGPRRVVLQVLEPESLVILDTATGRRRELARKADDETSRPWVRTPLILDEDQLIVAMDARTVARLDVSQSATQGRASYVWTRKLPSPLPLNLPPRLFGDSRHLLVLYEGNQLVRHDPATGRTLWTRALGLENLSEWPNAFALDADRFYCASVPATDANSIIRENATLSAYALADGQPLWSRPLAGPTTGWVVSLTDRHIAAYPSPVRSLDNSLEGLPLVICRRDTGALVQRLCFPVTVTSLAVQMAPRGMLVATQSGLWSLGEAQGVDGPSPPR